MNYTISAIPTEYNLVQYRSRLEARYARFFDLIKWKHEYEPIELPGCIPDFRIDFKCECHYCKSEFKEQHITILVAVKPLYNMQDFFVDPICTIYLYDDSLPCDGIGTFGNNPGISSIQLYGSKCPDHPIRSVSIPELVPFWEEYWKLAGNKTQYRKPKAVNDNEDDAE